MSIEELFGDTSTIIDWDIKGSYIGDKWLLTVHHTGGTTQTISSNDINELIAITKEI